MLLFLIFKLACLAFLVAIFIWIPVFHLFSQISAPQISLFFLNLEFALLLFFQAVAAMAIIKKKNRHSCIYIADTDKIRNCSGLSA